MAKPKIAKNVKIPSELFEHLLTASEMRMLKNRWQIIQHLEDGLPIRTIAEELKVGTDTVVRVARMVERGNLRKYLKKDEIRSKTPWIFGKSE